MGHRIRLDRVTNSKISSSDAKQAQAIKFVTLLTEQCRILLFMVLFSNIMLVSLLFSLIVFSALSVSSPKMLLSFAYSIRGNFKLSSANTYVTYSLNYQRKCSYNISFTDMSITKVTQL